MTKQQFAQFTVQETVNGWIIKQGGKQFVFTSGSPSALGILLQEAPEGTEQLHAEAYYRALAHACPKMSVDRAPGGVGIGMCARPSVQGVKPPEEDLEVPELAGDGGDAELVRLEQRKAKEGF